MSKECFVCAKSKVSGGSVTYRGKSKMSGGIGLQRVKCVKRTFKPNLQNHKINMNGTVRRVSVCVACLRSGAVVKAV